MLDLLKASVPEGSFKKVEDIKGSPVPNEEILENIRKSKDIDSPVFQKQPKRPGSFIFIAGGSTLLNHLDEIRARSESGEFICTSNMTHDFLVDNGIVPDATMVIDPKERVKGYIKKPQKKAKYYIGTVCNPQVAEGLLKAGNQVEKLLVAYGLESEVDIELQKEIYGNAASYNFLVGGTMAGLRAMPMALLLGFSKIEYYGFDSCFSEHYKVILQGEPGYEEAVANSGGRSFTDSVTGNIYAIKFPVDGGFYYAYKKTRAEDLQVAETPDGRRFVTSPVFAHQAKQFIKWADRMEGKLEVIVHGDSLSSNLYRCHKDALEISKKNAGNKRWSDGYRELQKNLHRDGNYGQLVSANIEEIGRSVLALYHALKRKVSILDYGCGNAFLKEDLGKIFNAVEVTNYDPFIEKYSQETDKLHDMSICLDVMEHVELPYVENTLKYIADRTKYMAIFHIAMDDAIKELEDGRNAHITQKSGEWWIKTLSKFFIVVEGKHNASHSIFICQAFDGKENMDNEKEQNGKVA